jgi:hypothetical protein
MRWKTLPIHATFTDKDGQTWDRRVAYNTDTGEVARTFGTRRGYADQVKTSRHVGYARSEDEALRLARQDLKNSF